MKGLLFWVEGNLGRAFELWQEPLNLLCEALSEHLPVWLLRYYQHPSTPAYEMVIWDGRGREITFWGAWPGKQLCHVVETLWEAEGFVPTAIVSITPSHTKCLTRWKSRFKAAIIDFLSAEGGRWPHSGFPQLSLSNANRLLIPIDNHSLKAARNLGKGLIEAGWAPLFVGWAAAITPLRQLHSHYPKHVTLHLGLPWLDVESLLDTCQAVVLPAAQPLLLALPWGKPVFYPGPVPWDAPGLYPYESVANLIKRLQEGKLVPSPCPTSSQIAQLWAKWFATLSQELAI